MHIVWKPPTYNKQCSRKLNSVLSLQTKYFPRISSLKEAHINIAVVVNYVSFLSGSYKLVQFILASRRRLVPWGKRAHFQMRSTCPRATGAQITGTWGMLIVTCNIRGKELTAVIWLTRVLVLCLVYVNTYVCVCVCQYYLPTITH